VNVHGWWLVIAVALFLVAWVILNWWDPN